MIKILKLMLVNWFKKCFRTTSEFLLKQVNDDPENLLVFFLSFRSIAFICKIFPSLYIFIMLMSSWRKKRTFNLGQTFIQVEVTCSQILFTRILCLYIGTNSLVLITIEFCYESILNLILKSAI